MLAFGPSHFSFSGELLYKIEITLKAIIFSQLGLYGNVDGKHVWSCCLVKFSLTLFSLCHGHDRHVYSKAKSQSPWA